MDKLLLSACLSFTFSLVQSQQNFLALKKGDKTIESFWRGDIIALQLHDKQWVKGEVSIIRNDSLYIRPLVIQFTMSRIDTLHYGIAAYSLNDLYALPKKGVLIDEVNGSYQISRSGGHVHWYWVKSGWIFRATGSSYIALTLLNGWIQHDFSWSQNRAQLGIAAAVFLFGVVLHETYSPVIKLGKKYYLKVM
ncbi:MAG: hypothetical protein Q8927_12690 [Bacteroidota bacterium]|nr:hypothetical protein [Bacteroidota bacterium]MDP4217050.1 hypothetical protein [Bacteroidota bacterium]MDP4244497.1 hypothetical protein [Bacteroidota bacterium]MDP4256212.1 hypothetical protein [Bacteroidota bacterium]MDP4258748.1 hypothetical protein [Bacteroidota bacterium]